MAKTLKQKVSVVIPAYNEEKQLPKCLEALKVQLTPGDEIIVVDNNSSDRTASVARKLGARVIKEKRQGVFYARTAGFNAAQNEIIGRIDADTLVDSDWIERLRIDFEDPELAAVNGPTYYYDQPAARAALKMDIQVRKELDKAIADYGFFLQGVNMALRKSAWNKVKTKLCSKEDFHEDIDLALHLYEAGFKMKLDERLIVGASSRRIDSSVKDFFEYNQKTVNNFKKHKLPTSKINVFIAFMMAIQLPLKVSRRFFDPRTGKISLAKALKYQEEIRADPNG